MTNVVIANAVKQSIAVLQKLDRHASLAVTNVVIANAVKQSIAMLQKTGSPRFARDDGKGGLPRSAHDDGGLPPHFAMKVVCHASLTITNVVIANAVKQSRG